MLQIEFLASREEVGVGMGDLANILEQMSGQEPEHQFLTPITDVYASVRSLFCLCRPHSKVSLFV